MGMHPSVNVEYNINYLMNKIHSFQGTDDEINQRSGKPSLG